MLEKGHHFDSELPARIIEESLFRITKEKNEQSFFLVVLKREDGQATIERFVEFRSRHRYSAYPFMWGIINLRATPSLVRVSSGE